MSVQISKKAELFYKALEDVWVAEQVWQRSPNNAVWHCTQAAEKTMKGFLRCFNKEYNYGHQLRGLLDAVDALIDLSPEVTQHVLYLDAFGSELRYKSMYSDPTDGDARIAILRTKQIMREFGAHPDISGLIKEAEEVHAKILKAPQKDL